MLKVLNGLSFGQGATAKKLGVETRVITYLIELKKITPHKLSQHRNGMLVFGPKEQKIIKAWANRKATN